GAAAATAEALAERLASAPRLLRVEAPLQRDLAELVVVAALRRVREYVVRLGDLLELVLGGLVAGIHVRVIAARELAIRLAQRLAVAVALHAEHLVQVAPLRRHRASPGARSARAAGRASARSRGRPRRARRT